MYNPSCPRPTDLPNNPTQGQFLNNFRSLNFFYGIDHVPFGNSVENIIPDPLNPTTNAIVTSSNHALTTGNTITFSHLSGLNDSVVQPWTIGLGPYPVTVLTADTFSVLVNVSTQNPYTSNTGDYTVNTAGYPYGYHKQISLNTPIVTPPNLLGAVSALYSKLFTAKPPFSQVPSPELFFLNTLERMLTNCPVVKTTTGTGFVTPWGFIINTGGGMNLPNAPTLIPWPIPFKSTVFTFIATPLTKSPSGFVLYSAVGNASFTASAGGLYGSVPITYLAIGV